MVNWLANPVILSATWLLAQERTQSALQRMLPEKRAAVFAAFVGFVILGLGLMALVWLGARVTRRYMNQEPLHRLDLEQIQDDWSRKPLGSPPSVSTEDRSPPGEGADV